MMEVHKGNEVYEFPNAMQFDFYGEGTVVIQDDNWDQIGAVSLDNVDVVAMDGEVVKRDANDNQ